MTDLEILARARMYIDKLANGINPLDGTNLSDDDIVNNVRISRCLFYVTGILDKVIANGGEVTASPISFGGKVEFHLSAEQLEKFEYSSEPITISEIGRRLNALKDDNNMKNITLRSITSWLVNIGLLCEVHENGKTGKFATKAGTDIGIVCGNREGQYGGYTLVLYGLDAQRFIIDNLETALSFYENEKAEKYSLAGTPWTDEQKEVLADLFKKGVSMREICITLKRKRGGITKQLQLMGLME